MLTEEELKKLRIKEDFEIADNIDKTMQIIKTKCKRCKAHSCMGCVFSSGEMMGFLEDCMRLIKIDCPRIEEKYPRIEKN